MADTGNHQVVVCDERGTPVYRFPHRISEGDGPKLGEPTSLVVDHVGRIFLVDGMVDYIDVLDHMGRRIQKIHPPEDGCEEPVRFKSLALGPDDEVYAALSCSDHTLVVIDTTLNVRRLIRLDAPDEERACISGLAVDDSFNIYITDPCATTMVQIYDANGNYNSGFGQHTAGFDNFSFPAGIVVMSNGNIWVLDTIRQVVSGFSNDGEFLTYFGGRGSHPGAFDFPSALASDGTNLLFVLERAGNRYQCFRLSESEP
ncbi:MAG: NHL repeat-containing protein [Candidatus Latescibacterota bacterium]|nr:MAG: NHL repeat-containing protein [Candidatus Latescibacterota bacterium]